MPGSAIAERLIRSGAWAGRPAATGYRCGLVGDTLVERVIWAEGAEPALAGFGLAPAPGHIWFRFWLLREQQIVEKYFDAAGRHLGTQVDVCMPLVLEEESWFTHDLLLDIFIAPDGQVTVGNEAAFEQAVAEGALSPEERERAEQHVRVLTAAIAQGRFPPALVRNFLPDMARIRQEQAP